MSNLGAISHIQEVGRPRDGVSAQTCRFQHAPQHSNERFCPCFLNFARLCDCYHSCMTPTWSAKQYLTFEDERTRPVRDLLAAVPPLDARRVIDLGCGPGNSTVALAARFPEATVSGIDSSPDMIEAARARLARAGFVVGDIEGWLDTGGGAEGARFDVILANAVLQWVPHHERVLPALAGRLAPGGALAVQMPNNLDEPAHRLMREIASDGPWAPKLGSAIAARASVREPGWYYELLRGAGCAADIWQTTYHHPLSGGVGAVVEWFKGSGLRPFLDKLGAEERVEYLARYQAALAREFAVLPDGSVLLPFPRLFIVAVR
jgi:trans-aconitate 2-methyltransferase